MSRSGGRVEMELLRRDSIALLTQHPTDIETLYTWMDDGTTLTTKMRSGSLLTPTDVALVERLHFLISSVVTSEEIVAYRGVTQLPTTTFAAPQFNAVAPTIENAAEYGAVMKIIIPAYTPAFYVSAWEHFAPEVEPSDEKEILLPPGVFQHLASNNFRFCPN